MKINIGTVYPRVRKLQWTLEEEILYPLTKTITVLSTEIMEALEEPVSSIVEAVHSVLEKHHQNWHQTLVTVVLL